MLEQPGLLFGPWTPPANAAQADRGKVRRILRPVYDLVTRGRLGVVKRCGNGDGTWRRWFAGGVLEVYETEDESLLCTVSPPWLLSRSWRVYDADGRRVAVVRGPTIFDGLGRLLATRRPNAGGRGDRFLGRTGAELAATTSAGEETLLRFSEEVADQPFAKMALLGALLCADSMGQPK